MARVLGHKPPNQIYLFQCNLNGIEMLGLAGSVGDPKLRTNKKYTEAMGWRRESGLFLDSAGYFTIYDQLDL
jgi:hypothetical protein